MDAPSAKYARGHFLQPEWTGEDSILERFEAVRGLLNGGSVLDVGAASRYRREDWIHGLIAAQCPDVVGIDLDEDAVQVIRQKGHDVRVGDARGFDVGRQFDVVFAGELIEHIDDVRGFLQSVRRHLRSGGRLVLTTPNPFYFANFVYRYGGQAHVHPEHTCWFCEDTVRRVLKVNGFDEVEVSFIGHTSPSALRQRACRSRKVLPAPETGTRHASGRRQTWRLRGQVAGVHVPGTGIPTPGMGSSWIDHPSWEVVGEASSLSGRDLEFLLTKADEDELRKTANAQLATFVLSLVALDAIERVGLQPTVCAGHSLGEYSALTASGAMTFEDGVRLVAERGEAMHDAGEENPGTMAAVLGLDDDAAEAACSGREGVWIANYNSPGQVVLAGHERGHRRGVGGGTQARCEEGHGSSRSPAPSTRH